MKITLEIHISQHSNCECQAKCLQFVTRTSTQTTLQPFEPVSSIVNQISCQCHFAEMGFLERTARKLFNTPGRDPFVDKSPKLLATPSSTPISKFSLPSSQTSRSSSASSFSSTSSFWTSPTPSRWPRCLPSSMRNTVSKRQIAVVVCLLLALLIWFLPQPHTWRRRVIHITVQQQVVNPYQDLRPIAAATRATKRLAPDPTHWLEQNSNDRHAENTGLGLLKSVPSLGHLSAKPRAALISLVRNSELAGLMQSMRQLEFQWNRKYNYPWIFFNDEPFSDEFKVGRRL